MMARLTLSALDRASCSPGFWGEPEVHRALLVSGLSVLVCSLARLQNDLSIQCPPGPSPPAPGRGGAPPSSP
ncbi:hypothetical protein L107_12776 [Cyanobium sp. Copco_Reservoir_LC18]|nr:hypothetical protein L107_12776 [Cyanobium sp. Copco_Reservoir_LC18]